MKFKVKIEPAALADLQDIIDWYNAKKPGLGKRFHDVTIKIINGFRKILTITLYVTKKFAARL